MKNRILFVDDEQHLLDGLKRSLRGQRNVWDMFFVPSGEEALRMVEAEPFDVVVSDMRMPGMSGAELLERLSTVHPQMVRMILSGHSDEAMILRAIPYAHQFLSKPCDADVIKRVISRSLRLKSLVCDVRLQTLVSQIKALPSLPSLYVELTELLKSDQATVQKIGEVISKDPAMVSKILQMVNSAFFGVGRHISNPVQAATMLGTETLRSLVLSAGIFLQFDADQLKIGNFTLEALHKHSLHVSLLAKAIAESMGADKQTLEDCLLAGLLHDIGKLILVQGMPEEYKQFFHEMHDCKAEIVATERKVFNADHGRVGAYLLGLWALPESLVEAVAYHHDPQSAEHIGFSPLLAVHVADVFTSSDSVDAAVQPAGLDLAYLEASGLSNRLDEWKQLHVDLIERGE
ncbi:MAG: response regulator [Sedimenticola sp.]|uniref:HDOD domain-containing protein n=1 Tax=Sedimenticola thiotaurini TaxID=1543721 RepID=A0A558DF28_9GAMM|nr:response regulator [Sedimenticola sp.]TVT59647.1 MAG: HDOD domain-containing protein [Sedimenticola thiotaurini]